MIGQLAWGRMGKQRALCWVRKMANANHKSIRDRAWLYQHSEGLRSPARSSATLFLSMSGGRFWSPLHSHNADGL